MCFLTSVNEAALSSAMTTLLTPDLIRAARAMLSLTQEQVGERAGITQKVLSDIETERKPPSAKSSEKLKRFFESNGIQFTAVNSATSDLEGTGVRWRPASDRLDTKII